MVGRKSHRRQGTGRAQPRAAARLRRDTAGERAEAELDRIFRLTPDLLCIAGFDMRFKRLNPAWEEILGYSRAELLAKPYLDFVHPDDRERTLAEAQKLTTGAATVSFENRYRCKDGSYKWLLWNASPVLGEKLIYAAARDITERRGLERMKDEFVSMVSHELRTPLSSLRGALGLVGGGELGALTDKGRRMLEVALEETERLVRLTNDIIDIERMEAGRFTLVKHDCDAAGLAAKAVEALQPMAEKAGVKLETAAAPVALHVDPDRIQQALTNLIGNAVKFSPAGGTVRVGAAPRGDEVVFQVQDEGCGIATEDQSGLFERFQQLGPASRAKGGAGLGLFITRSIVWQHGGRIWAESAAGQGSTFSFTLPLGRRKSRG